MSLTTQYAFSTKKQPYQTLIALDKVLRLFSIPEHLRCPAHASETDRSWSPGPNKSYEQYCTLAIYEGSQYRSMLHNLIWLLTITKTSFTSTAAILCKRFAQRHRQTTHYSTSLRPQYWQLAGVLVA